MGSDIKLSACYARIFGAKEWYYRKEHSTPTYGYFNSNNPEYNIHFGNIPEKSMTYHLVLPPDTVLIKNSHYSEWKDANNRSMYVDWGKIMMLGMRISLGQPNYDFDYNFWYSIRRDEFVSYPLGKPKPIFRRGDSEMINPIAYEQDYPGNLTVRVNCENRDEMDPYQDGFLSLPRIGPVIYMKCPKPQIFSTSHIDHINPQIRTIPSDHK